MSERLFDPLDAIRAAGFDGLHTDELGAILHHPRHGIHERCHFCGAAGQEVGTALRARGLVQQRRRRAPGGDTYLVWTVAGRLTRPVDRDNWEIPY